jgi:hypothetical protein
VEPSLGRRWGHASNVAAHEAICNLAEGCPEIYRDPENGAYAERLSLTTDETIAPLAFPDLTLRVGDFLP